MLQVEYISSESSSLGESDKGNDEENSIPFDVTDGDGVIDCVKP